MYIYSKPSTVNMRHKPIKPNQAHRNGVIHQLGALTVEVWQVDITSHVQKTCTDPENEVLKIFRIQGRAITILKKKENSIP